MQQVKGSVLKSRLVFVEDRFGADGLTRVLAAVPEDDRRALKAILTVKWYDFEVGRRLDDAIVQVVGGGDPAFFERLGEASAEKNLTTLHKGFLSPGKPHEFLGRAQAVYALYYDTGRRDYQQTGPMEGVLTTTGAETYSQPDCLTVIGWYKKGLEMCGARGVQISEPECRARGGDVCRYRVSWASMQG